MPPVPTAQHYEIISIPLTLAEERGSVPLSVASSAAGVPVEELRELLEPVLTRDSRPTGRDTPARTMFLLDELYELHADEHSWMRSGHSNPSNHDDALRMLLSAVVYQATEPRSATLDSAIAKLRARVALDLVPPAERATSFEMARQARDGQRSLRFRYAQWKDDAATQREVLPYAMFGKWGHWFVLGPEVGSEIRKAWRIDRMEDAAVGDATFWMPDDVTLPDWFDLTALEHTLTVRLRADLLPLLPQPHRLAQVTPDGKFVITEITVAGDRQLDHLLVSLGPDGEVIGPEQMVKRRREVAQRLLGIESWI